MSVSLIDSTKAAATSGLQKAKPTFNASVHREISASISLQWCASKKFTPAKLEIWCVNHIKSWMTDLLSQIGAKGMTFPHNFTYDDCRARHNKGQAFSAQLQYPNNHCQSHRGCHQAGCAINWETSSIKSVCFSKGIVIVIESKLTCNPIMVSSHLNSCFFFSCGILTSLNNLSKLTCFLGYHPSYGA